MRLLVLVRTVAACLPLSSSVQHNKELITISRDLLSPTTTTDSTPARALNHSVVYVKNESFGEDKNFEARGLTEEMMQIMNWVEREEMTAPSMRNVEKYIKEAWADGVRQALISNKIVLNYEDWMKLRVKASLEVPLIRKFVVQNLLNSRNSPPSLFRDLKLHGLCNPADKDSISPKLLLWFDYIQEYRRRSGASTSDTATSNLMASDSFTNDIATNNRATNDMIASDNSARTSINFENKELFKFLETEFNLQNFQQDMSSAVAIPGETPFDSRKQVVALFELLRHNLHTKSFAKGMQFYLVSESNTMKLVLDAWLQTKEAPETVFRLMRLRDKHSRIRFDDNLFKVWLTYLALCWDNVPIEELFFNGYERLLRVLVASGISFINGLIKLQSLAFRAVLAKYPLHGSMPHFEYLKRLWQIRQWMEEDAVPKRVFCFLGLTGKINAGDSSFITGNLYIVAFKRKYDYTSEEVIDLLSPANGIDGVERLYQSVKNYALVGDVANDVLNYLSDKSANMLQPLLSDIKEGEKSLQYFFSKGNFLEFSELFRHVVAYYRLIKKMDTKDAIKKVITWMKTQITDSDWIVARAVLEKDPRLKESLSRLHYVLIRHHGKTDPRSLTNLSPGGSQQKKPKLSITDNGSKAEQSKSFLRRSTDADPHVRQSRGE